MKKIYPAFADKVHFYAIGQSPVEAIGQLEADRIEQDYPWPIAKTNSNVLKKLKVVQPSTKIAVDHRGIISYRTGYANGGPDEWKAVFSDLVESSGD